MIENEKCITDKIQFMSKILTMGIIFADMLIYMHIGRTVNAAVAAGTEDGAGQKDIHNRYRLYVKNGKVTWK